MKPENAKIIWKRIQEAGEYLKDKLPQHPNHPNGRNPYAHVAICVKSKFKESYKDIRKILRPGASSNVAKLAEHLLN